VQLFANSSVYITNRRVELTHKLTRKITDRIVNVITKINCSNKLSEKPT